MMLRIFLFVFHLVSADVIREDGYHDYEGQFTVEHKGRMLRVLMFFHNIEPEECALHCVRHLRCRTFNYHLDKRDCELTDVDFDKMNADTITYGWYNYGTPTKVDGGWSAWRNFTDCTRTCGNGTLEQFRECDSPKPEHGGADCKGRMERKVKCNTHGCPVMGGWSRWKNSTSCTQTCGNGTLEQKRVCDSPKPINGGAKCKGIDTRTMECNTQKCPIHGGWSMWTNSTKCTKQCESGTVEQRRECDSPKPEYGGNDCKGEKKRTIECNTHGCPVNGGWGSWMDSTHCTKTCGGGTIQQKRACDFPTPKHGGVYCKERNERTVECNTHACPIDGGWSKWRNNTKCFEPCGIFEQLRKCDSPKPENEGAVCKGEERRTLKCTNKECKMINVALNKNAEQSSTFSMFKATFAIDGSTSTMSTTIFEENPWWIVDLGNVVDITYMLISGSTTYNKVLIVETRQKHNGAWERCYGIRKIEKLKFSCAKLTNARYVRIRSTERCIIVIHELEVYGPANPSTTQVTTPSIPPTIVNVALGKTTKQSSTRDDDPYFKPSNAVDGDTNTPAGTKTEANPWWEVDLGEVRVIKDISLHANVHNSYNKGLVSETREVESDDWSLCQNMGDVKMDKTELKCTEQPTNARFLRIRSTENNGLYFAEIEIFGY